MTQPGPAPTASIGPPARRSIAQAWLAQLSLRSRITLLVAVAVAVAVALTSVAAFLTVRRQLGRELDNSLVTRANAAAESPLTNLSFYQGIDPALLPVVLGVGDVSVALITVDGRRLAGNGPSVGEPERRVAAGQQRLSVRGVNGFRVVAVPSGNQRGVALVLAQSTDQSQRTLRALRFVLFGVGGIGVAVAAFVGLAVARAGVRPVERLTEAAERVARTGRLDPIEVDGEDELARLASTFNAMLAALGGARVRERQLVADAGHELRTPLTSLRTNLDLLAQSDAAAPGAGLAASDREELLSDVRAQLHELSGLVDDLVELSREDTTGAHHQPVDLAAVVHRSVDRVRLRSPGLAFDVTTAPWTVVGDAPLLERAVTNLLDNAGKWSPSGGTVAVRLAGGVLEVADQGPGIAPEDLAHVFDRFYRSAEARALPGSGLGLSIVARAAGAHGGTVTAGRAVGGGALLTLRLPGSPAVPGTPEGLPRSLR